MKRVIVSSIVLIVVFAVLVTPWYPITTSHVVPQTQSYTTYQTATVYTLASPVQVQSVNYGPPSPPCATGGWIYCKGSAMFKSQTFNLQAGITYTVNIDQCQECDFYIQQAFSPYDTFVSIVGSGKTSFTAPASGIYQGYVANNANSVSMLTAISIIGTQTQTTYSTTSVTQYSQTMVPPYTTLGIAVSVTVLALIAALVIATILMYSRKQHAVKNPQKAKLTQRFCIECGKEVPLKSKFCNECGTEQP